MPKYRCRNLLPPDDDHRPLNNDRPCLSRGGRRFRVGGHFLQSLAKGSEIGWMLFCAVGAGLLIGVDSRCKWAETLSARLSNGFG